MRHRTPPGGGPTPEEGQRIFMRIVAELGLTVPHFADRWAVVGEKCTCTMPALVVFEKTRYGDLGYCGGNHG